MNTEKWTEAANVAESMGCDLFLLLTQTFRNVFSGMLRFCFSEFG